MKVYRLSKEVELHGSMEEVWDFFSTPLNLNEITPDNMEFEILTDLSNQKMYPGMIIQYRVKPFLNIPMNWVTEITHCSDYERFVDEQRFGPYAFWHHKHLFKDLGNGKIGMVDIVDYAIGWGFIGRIAHWLFVKKQLENIFSHRNKVVSKIFGKKAS